MMIDTHSIDVNLLRSIECPHPRELHRTVSECVIHQDKDPGIGPPYEVARLVIVCTSCGLPVEVRDIERDLT